MTYLWQEHNLAKPIHYGLAADRTWHSGQWTTTRMFSSSNSFSWAFLHILLRNKFTSQPSLHLKNKMAEFF